MTRKMPPELDRITDVVLNYRPATKGKPYSKPKPRKSRAKKKAQKNGQEKSSI